MATTIVFFITVSEMGGFFCWVRVAFGKTVAGRTTSLAARVPRPLDGIPCERVVATRRVHQCDASQKVPRECVGLRTGA
jgi:hypothetical protein